MNKIITRLKVNSLLIVANNIQLNESKLFFKLANSSFKLNISLEV